MRRFQGFATATVMLAALPFMAQAKDAEAPLWSKSCGKDAGGKPVCVVEQFAIAMPQKAVMLHIVFAPSDKADQTQMALTTPLGVALGPDVTLSVDGSKPIALPFERCSGQGCLAQAVLDKAALEKFTKGKALTVRYALPENGPLDIPIRLDGLADALKSLSK